VTRVVWSPAPSPTSPPWTCAPRGWRRPPRDLVDHVVFAATAADITHVVVGGRPVVEQGRHRRVDDVGRALAGAIGALEA